MNGIEKITGRIEADAREQASAITADAEAKCAEIRAGYDKQAQDQYWARVRDGVKICEDRVQRMGRLAEMEARKSILALKQEMVDAAFAAALERICTMPQADYVAYLAKLAAQAATTGTEALVFNAKDQAACGQAVADAANALLAQQGKQARLTVSPATRDLRAGFVLQQGDIEVNCAVETSSAAVIWLLRSPRSCSAHDLPRPARGNELSYMGRRALRRMKEERNCLK